MWGDSGVKTRKCTLEQNLAGIPVGRVLLLRMTIGGMALQWRNIS